MAANNKKSIKERLLSGSVWALLGRVMGAFFGLAVNMLLARLLTPEDFGAYFLTFSVVIFAALVAQMGTKQTIVRLMAESLSQEKFDQVISAVKTVIVIVLGGVLVVAGTYALFLGEFLGSRVFESELMGAIALLTALWIVAWTLQTVVTEMFRGFHDIRLASLFGGLCTSAISSVLFLGLWLLQGQTDLKTAVLLSVVAGLSSVFIAVILLGKKLSLTSVATSPGNYSQVVSIAWPLYLTGLLLFAISEGHLWILGYFRPESEVALYGAATRLVNLIAMPLLIVNNVLPPMITELYTKGDNVQVEKVLQNTAAIVGVVSIAILGMLMVFGEWILLAVYGEFYVSALDLMMVVAVGKTINVLTGSPGVLMAMAGQQKALLWTSLLAGIAGVLTSIYLVGAFHGIGVAIGMSAGLALHNILMWFYCHKKLNIWTHMKFGWFPRTSGQGR